jgi:hypothetical protein
LFLSFADGQGGTKLSITKLHFNSGLEKNLFEAVEKHQPYDPVQLFIIIDSAITEKSIHDAVQSVNEFAEQLKGEKPGKTFSKTVQNYFDETHERFFQVSSAFFNQILVGNVQLRHRLVHSTPSLRQTGNSVCHKRKTHQGWPVVNPAETLWWKALPARINHGER